MKLTAKFPYVIRIGRELYSRHQEIYTWCNDAFNHMLISTDPNDSSEYTMSERWRVDSMFGVHHFYFRDEADAMLFALKWGSNG